MGDLQRAGAARTVVQAAYPDNLVTISQLDGEHFIDVWDGLQSGDPWLVFSVSDALRLLYSRQKGDDENDVL